MPVLSPNLDNFRVEFDGELFPKSITKKYDDFLFQMNGNIKDIKTLIQSEVTMFTTPEITIPEISVQGLNNSGKNGVNSQNNTGSLTTNIDYISNANFDEALGTKTITITMRNILWNYVYLNELMRLMFQRNNKLNEFSFYVYYMYDGGIPLMKKSFRNCIIKSLPAIQYSHADSLTNNPTFDVTIRFNNYDFEFMLPEFNQRISIL